MFYATTPIVLCWSVLKIKPYSIHPWTIQHKLKQTAVMLDYIVLSHIPAINIISHKMQLQTADAERAT